MPNEAILIAEPATSMACLESYSFLDEANESDISHCGVFGVIVIVSMQAVETQGWQLSRVLHHISSVAVVDEPQACNTNET